MEYMIIVLVYGIIWGVVCNAVIKNKGYNANWFWWGFFFGIFAFLVAVTKPNSLQSQNYSSNVNGYMSGVSSQYENERYERTVLSQDGWKCPVCNRVNSSYVTTCLCGTAKSMVEKRSFDDVIRGKRTWTCKKCGNENSSECKVCSCGAIKAENFSWVCAKCGTINPEHKYLCDCGTKKSEGEKAVSEIEMASKATTEKIDANNNLEKLEVLKKYKELLDMGAITQEEFNNKKAEIL